MKVISVVGARPQFVKAAALSGVLRRKHEEILVHTGQHYDPLMSRVFFDEMGIPQPSHDLEVGSRSHAEQTAAIMIGLERLLEQHRPDALIVYGDTNSTLGAALAASKLGVPIAHVEAGLRSHNRRMPEEINRIVTDCLSSWLFVPSRSAAEQLAREGVAGVVHEVGDIMLDSVLMFRERAINRSRALERLGLREKEYYLATIHRAENTDDRTRLAGIVKGLGRLSRAVVVPVHPRTRKQLAAFAIPIPDQLRIVEPAGYLDMLVLQAQARCVITDSGGVQKEAYYLHAPCVTVRDETEWPETVATGWNRLCASSPDAILDAVSAQDGARSREHPALYGVGDTAERIVRVIDEGRV